MTTTTDIKIDKIRIDGNTQPRTKIDTGVVSDYAEAFELNESLPPVDVFHDGKDYWLADGFHRYHGAAKAGRKTIACKVHKGTQRDAILFSVGANAVHGLRRTNEDKRAAVMTLLGDEEWSQWSAREIARACAVSHVLVGDVRDSLNVNSSIEKTERVKFTTKHGTEGTRPAKNNAKPKPAENKADNPDSVIPASAPETPAATETAPTSDFPAGFDPTTFDPEMNPDLDRKSVAKLPRDQQVIEQPKMIEAFCRSVRKFVTDNMPSDPLLDETALNIADQQLTAYLSSLRQRKAYGICPKCPEKINPKCGFCKGCGYVTKTTFESAGGVK